MHVHPRGTLSPTGGGFLCGPDHRAQTVQSRLWAADPSGSLARESTEYRPIENKWLRLNSQSKHHSGTSLVARWVRIHQPVRGMRLGPWQQLRLCVTTTEPASPRPALCKGRSHTRSLPAATGEPIQQGRPGTAAAERGPTGPEHISCPGRHRRPRPGLTPSPRLCRAPPRHAGLLACS